MTLNHDSLWHLTFRAEFNKILRVSKASKASEAGGTVQADRIVPKKCPVCIEAIYGFVPNLLWYLTLVGHTQSTSLVLNRSYEKAQKRNLRLNHISLQINKIYI